MRFVDRWDLPSVLVAEVSAGRDVLVVSPSMAAADGLRVGVQARLDVPVVQARRGVLETERSRVRFVSRHSPGAGRGMAVDVVLVDEQVPLDDPAVRAAAAAEKS